LSHDSIAASYEAGTEAVALPIYEEEPRTYNDNALVPIIIQNQVADDNVTDPVNTGEMEDPPTIKDPPLPVTATTTMTTKLASLPNAAVWSTDSEETQDGVVEGTQIKFVPITAPIIKHNEPFLVTTKTRIAKQIVADYEE
jgi:hypothetical protein